MDRTVRSDQKNLQPFIFYDFFSFKNRFMKKKQKPVQTAVGPHDPKNCDQTVSHSSLFPFIDRA